MIEAANLRIRRRPPVDGPELSTSSVLQRVYANRGVVKPDDLDLALGHILTPEALPDIDIAAERLCTAVTQNEQILIVGDFDADGATSVTLCMLILKAFGAEKVDYLVPNRFEYGYGLSPEIVSLSASYDPSVIVTVDNGISSLSGVQLACDLGIDVIVTDHHLPGEQRPAAYAIVNPNLPESQFASRALAGVGVAYYLMGALRQKLVAHDWFAQRSVPNLANYLDLVALGTIADVVPLDVNNRRLVQQGILRIRAGRCRPGMRALADIARRALPSITAQDLAFALGPRLNAAGRLEDMAIGIKCLLAESLSEARSSATALDQLNVARRQLERDMVDDAQMLVASEQADQTRTGLTVYHQSFHQGVVGIVAGRLREKFNRPVICFADAGDSAPDELKGSARSIEGLHIRDALDVIATGHPGLLLKFGGHAMAAGLSIKRVHLKRFGAIFDKVVREQVTSEMLDPVIVSDGELKETELSLETAQQLVAGGPWGSQFPEPIFDGQFRVVSQRVVGGEHLKLVLKQSGRVIDAIAFRQAPLPDAVEAVEIAYKLAVNDYGQIDTPQLIVEYVRPIP